MEDKKDLEKNPIQEEKEARVQEILAEEVQEEPKPKKRRRRRKKAEPEPEPEQPQINPEELAAEADFLLHMIQTFRQFVGVTEPIPEPLAVSWKQSYIAVGAKYHSIVQKWLPEMMFIGSTGLIVVDTMQKMPKHKEEEKLEDEDRKREPKNPLEGMDLNR